MKYSFTRRHPAVNAWSTAVTISSSVMFLLIASRSLCDPASGAKVSPDLWPSPSSRARGTVNESTRSDGTEIAVPVPSSRFASRRSTCSSWE